MDIAGIEVWDEAGNILLDGSVRPFQNMGKFTTTAVNGSLPLYINTPGEFAYFSRPVSNPVNKQPVHPIVTWSNNVVYWQFPTDATWPSGDVIKVPNVIYWGVQ